MTSPGTPYCANIFKNSTTTAGTGEILSAAETWRKLPSGFFPFFEPPVVSKNLLAFCHATVDRAPQRLDVQHITRAGLDTPADLTDDDVDVNQKLFLRLAAALESMKDDGVPYRLTERQSAKLCMLGH